MNKKITVPIKGMHCRSCELLTERHLGELAGVSKVRADRNRSCASLEYSAKAPSRAELEQALQKAGYEYDDQGSLSKNWDNYYELAQALIVVLALYWLFTLIGVERFFEVSNFRVIGPVVALLIGLIAGFSSCMALVGGLVLSISARWNQTHQGQSLKKSLEPHWYFNLGRVLGYGVLGALLGALGSVVSWSISLSAWLVVAVSVLMIVLAFKLLELPILSHWEIAWPKSWLAWLGFGERAEGAESRLKTMLFGALSFFVPCGFTQAMQVYALGSGSARDGALVMAIFALGTAPGLLGLGAVVSMIKGTWSGLWFKVAGLTVLALGLFNLNNAWTLLKTSNFGAINNTKQKIGLVASDDQQEAQVIRMTQSGRGYSPNKLTVRVGRPVRWLIDAKNANSCSAVIVAPKIGVNQQLSLGENVINFTPAEVGKIYFACSMGMYKGEIEVVE